MSYSCAADKGWSGSVLAVHSPLFWRPRLALGLLLSGLLTACGGGGGGGGSSSPPPAVPAPATTEEEVSDRVTVSGSLRYDYVPSFEHCALGLDYGATEQRAIRGATVQLLDADNQAVLASTTASAAGNYSFEVQTGRRVMIRVRAELQRQGSPGWDVEVRNNTMNTGSPLEHRPLYVLDSTAFTADADQERNLLAATGWDGSAYTGPRSAAPFAILDTIFSAMQLVLGADPDAEFPELDVFWSPDNSTAGGAGFNVDRGAIGTSYYDPNRDSLFLLGRANDDTEEFDSHVIAHEWGHYFEDNFSRSDSIGGPHSLGQALDPRLAFGEGWATGLAGIILRDPDYCDTGGPDQGQGWGINLERGEIGTPGWFNETSVSAIVYDLWDSPPGDDDGMSIGFGPIFEAFISDQALTPAFTTAHSFAASLKARLPADELAIDRLLARHDIRAVDAWASGETNDSENGMAGEDEVLPIYTRLRPGESSRVCSTGIYDPRRDGNKLSVFRFLRLPIASPGAYLIRVRNVDPPTSGGGVARSTDSDPDVLLFQQGRRLASGQSGAANVEEFTTPILSAGDYVLTVSEYRYADPNTDSSFPETSCFEVTVNPAR